MGWMAKTYARLKSIEIDTQAIYIVAIQKANERNTPGQGVSIFFV